MMRFSFHAYLFLPLTSSVSFIFVLILSCGEARPIKETHPHSTDIVSKPVAANGPPNTIREEFFEDEYPIATYLYEGTCGSGDVFTGTDKQIVYKDSSLKEIRERSYGRHEAGHLRFGDTYYFEHEKPDARIILDLLQDTDEYLRWNQDGIPVSRIINSHRDNRSQYQEWWNDGNPKHSSIRVDGKLSGREIYRYPNGKVRCFIDYKDDVVNGLFAVWDEKGILVQKQTLCDGYPCDMKIEERSSSRRIDHDVVLRDKKCNPDIAEVLEQDARDKADKEKWEASSPEEKQAYYDAVEGLSNDAPPKTNVESHPLTCAQIRKWKEESLKPKYRNIQRFFHQTSYHKFVLKSTGSCDAEGSFIGARELLEYKDTTNTVLLRRTTVTLKGPSEFDVEHTLYRDGKKYCSFRFDSSFAFKHTTLFSDGRWVLRYINGEFETNPEDDPDKSWNIDLEGLSEVLATENDRADSIAAIFISPILCRYILKEDLGRKLREQGVE
jgi:hypothetical protein